VKGGAIGEKDRRDSDAIDDNRAAGFPLCASVSLLLCITLFALSFADG